MHDETYDLQNRLPSKCLVSFMYVKSKKY